MQVNKGKKSVYLLTFVRNAIKIITTKLVPNAFYLQDSNPVPLQKSWKTNEAQWTLLPHCHSLHCLIIMPQSQSAQNSTICLNEL